MDVAAPAKTVVPGNLMGSCPKLQDIAIQAENTLANLRCVFTALGACLEMSYAIQLSDGKLYTANPQTAERLSAVIECVSSQTMKVIQELDSEIDMLDKL